MKNDAYRYMKKPVKMARGGEIRDARVMTELDKMVDADTGMLNARGARAKALKTRVARARNEAAGPDRSTPASKTLVETVTDRKKKMRKAAGLD